MGVRFGDSEVRVKLGDSEVGVPSGQQGPGESEWKNYNLAL